MGKALGWLAGQSAPGARVLLVTDGVATAGETANDRLRAQVRGLARRGVQRLDVLAVGGIRDDERLSRLVSAGLPRAGVVLDADAGPAEQLRRLTLATRSDLAVELDGAAWVWPQRLDGIQPGDEVLIYADLPAERPLRLTIGGRPMAIASSPRVLAPAPRPLLERAWVKARLARLMLQRETLAGSDPDLAEALRKQVIELSVRHRVLSPFTALLVLETERDYQRFGIERRALADILSVGPTGVEVLKRKDIAMVAAPAPKAGAGGAAPQEFRRMRNAAPGGLRGSSSGAASEGLAAGPASQAVPAEPAQQRRARAVAPSGPGAMGGAPAQAPMDEMKERSETRRRDIAAASRRPAPASPPASPPAPTVRRGAGSRADEPGQRPHAGR